MVGVPNGKPCRVIWLWVAAVVALGLFATFSAGPADAAEQRTDWTKLRVLNMSHQGGEDEAPSNTMYALKRSLRIGSDMLEIDVHTSADGEIIAIHDATVDRTTDGSGRVYDMTVEQIQALDAGYNLVPGEGARSDHPEADYPFRGVRTGEKKPPPSFGPDDFSIPTLPEIIEAYPDVPINIEIKGAADEDRASYIRNAEILAEYLNELGRVEGVIVVSFSDEAIARFHQLAPQIDLAPAIAGVAGYKLTGAPPPEGTVAFQVPIEFQGIEVTDEAFIDQAHADGFGVHNWTINDPDEMNMLLDWGTDGIMTAEPARLEQVLCERGEPRPVRPSSAPGRHCSDKASIACDVQPAEVKRVGRKGRKAKVTLVRGDQFDSRCAGRVVLKAIGARARKKGNFDFGWEPPADDGSGGPSELTTLVKLNRKLRRQINRKGKVQVLVHPYGAFVDKSRIRVK